MTWWTDDSPIPDPEGKGARAVSFIQKLRLHEGKLAGQRFILARWQRRIVQRIYGDTREDGRRRIRTVFILLPRGNGKTTLCAGLGLLHLTGPEKEAGGQVIVAAADREQASIAYNAASGMIAQPLDLSGREGEPCWLGVDLSSTQDLTAVVAAFRDDDGGYTLAPWFFCPADNLAKRQERDQIPYLRWAEEDHLIATPGNVVDYAFVEQTIAEIAERFRIQELAIDPAMSAGIVPRLQDLGINVVHFRQGWLSMTPAIKETERALLAGKVRHGGHPVLRWNFGNAVIDPGPTGDTARFSKAKSAEKIDGAVAAAMAIARAQASDAGPSIFESEWVEDITFA